MIRGTLLGVAAAALVFGAGCRTEERHGEAQGERRSEASRQERADDAVVGKRITPGSWEQSEQGIGGAGEEGTEQE